jgi:hypothetical protein
MKSKSLAILTILLFALSISGFVYASWRDFVTIDVTAEMGEFIVGILDGSLTVCETTNGEPEDADDFPWDPKPWVANTVVDLAVSETSVHHEPPATVWKELYIVVDNAYPQYDVHLDFVIKNAGTIPAKPYLSSTGAWIQFTGTEESADGLDTGPLQFHRTWAFGDPDGDLVMEWYTVDAYISDDEQNRIINVYIEAEFPEDDQLHPCNSYPVHIDFDFTQEAEQCHTYEMEITLGWLQWNKQHEYSW